MQLLRKALPGEHNIAWIGEIEIQIIIFISNSFYNETRPNTSYIPRGDPDVPKQEELTRRKHMIGNYNRALLEA
jgi:hypothetical protein